MTNKRAKLKDQEKILEGSASQTVPQIFEGLSIYINGYTNPPQSELRTQIILHGGDYQHYLKKSSVTHIIATNLTHAKCNEFRAYKVVKPNWLMDSIKEQRLLPWNDYRITGKDAAQRELQFQRSKKQQQQQQQQHEEEDNTKSLLKGKL
ncbi:BRCT domain-containing protein [Circinella umbellata]|nr:BRCT domain-containing protein [Circinella umbellata]